MLSVTELFLPMMAMVLLVAPALFQDSGRTFTSAVPVGDRHSGAVGSSANHRSQNSKDSATMIDGATALDGDDQEGEDATQNGESSPLAVRTIAQPVTTSPLPAEQRATDCVSGEYICTDGLLKLCRKKKWSDSNKTRATACSTGRPCRFMAKTYQPGARIIESRVQVCKVPKAGAPHRCLTCLHGTVVYKKQ